MPAPKKNKNALIGDKPASAFIRFRVTEKEKKEFESKAEKHGFKNLSSWIRELLRKA